MGNNAELFYLSFYCALMDMVLLLWDEVTPLLCPKKFF
jgi:hypothetical protein